ncbi:ferric reductase family protein [Aspergillus candidus]|uniref:FRE family ferric-chelate reductase n=1 Tax=Aspergillus candidus TaxID=41067 RepID=A0A2I2F4L2_ASPCN|nr:FRE family ferric-chelate reductase [Aspergillus candidus]PLB35592.1 FRE family ferric-chelate reductase [Aspergillus candidus]
MWPVHGCILLLLISVGTATVLEHCLQAVDTAYGYITFAGSPPKDVWHLRCQNPLRVTSIYAASGVYCNPSENAAGQAWLASSCQEFAGLELIPREQLATNLTDDAIRHMRVVAYGDILRREPVDFPVMLSSSYFDRAFQTIDTWETQVWYNHAFGLAMYAFWGWVLALGILHRSLQYTKQSCRVWEDRASSSSAGLYTRFHKVYNWVRTHLLTPSPLPSRGRRLFWWTFPARIQALVVLLCWVLNIVLCAIMYKAFPGNLYWADISSQLLRYIADRTGIISFANIPLIWLFAGRNNIFLWATGWSFATFNLFHRHVAWIATIQAVVHTLLYLVIFIQNGNTWKKLQKPYLLWGTFGMVAMLLLWPTAVDFCRRRTYEAFLILHILLSTVALVGCFYHTVIFEGNQYWAYLWPAVGIWVVDRSLRLVRVIHCNFHVYFQSRKKLRVSASTAVYDEAADVIRLEIVPGSPLLRPHPGQYYYLYQPLRLKGWESHPFTLGAWSYTAELPTAMAQDDPIRGVSRVPLLSDAVSRQYQEVVHCDDQQKVTLIFWIRPFDGWTRHLRQQCLRRPNRTTAPDILLEGPYGHEFPLWNHESVLFIAGGTGIAAMVPYIQDHMARSSTDASATCVQDLHLVWTAREASFIRNLVARELRPALARNDFHASFYSTLTPKDQRYGEVDDSDFCPGGNLADKDLGIISGRPDLQTQILTHAHEARLSESSAVVIVCGPPAMADEARAAVHLAMRQGYRDLHYVEESFNW